MGSAWVHCTGCTKPKPFPENKNTYNENYVIETRKNRGE